MGLLMMDVLWCDLGAGKLNSSLRNDVFPTHGGELFEYYIDESFLHASIIQESIFYKIIIIQMCYNTRVNYVCHKLVSLIIHYVYTVVYIILCIPLCLR